MDVYKGKYIASRSDFYHFIHCILSLVLDLGDQCSNMGQQLNSKLVASLDKFLRILSCANTGRGAGQDDCTGRKSGSLGEEADQLGDAEDKVTAVKFNVSWYCFV